VQSKQVATCQRVVEVELPFEADELGPAAPIDPRAAEAEVTVVQPQVELRQAAGAFGPRPVLIGLVDVVLVEERLYSANR
jgi:hypothetical protein